MGSTHSLTRKLEKHLDKLETKQWSLVQAFHSKQAEIMNNPEKAGKYLKGDLQGYQVFDWKLKGHDVRICYRYDRETNHVTFLMFGTRENFYAEVKRYI